jgi:hypothetical protein
MKGMLARLPFLMLGRLWAALLLATIGLHAAAPAPAAAAAIEQTHGSAFAVNSYEVALVVQRGDRAVRQAPLAPQPLSPATVPHETRPARVATLPVLPAPRPDSTGPPPPRDIHSWEPAPRAPPRA